jgi:hypothetical protein
MKSPDLQLNVSVASHLILSPMNTKMYIKMAGNSNEVLATDPFLFKSLMSQK